jgi:magnesium transporter
VRGRLPGLALPLAAGLLVSELLRYVGAPAGSALLPALVLLESSVAVQAAALLLRRLGTGRLDGGAVRAVLAEALRGLAMGLVLAAAAGVYAWFRAPAARLSLPLSLALGAGVAGLVGAGAPVLLRRMGWDPGRATAPAVGAVAAAAGVAMWVGFVQLLPGP